MVHFGGMSLLKDDSDLFCENKLIHELLLFV